jgi:hypothetical protein
MFKMGSHGPFWHLKHKLWSKERPGVKLAIWFSITKSQELTWFTRVQEMYDISLESSWQGLQVFFRSHCNQRFTHEVMHPKVAESSYGNFETLTWESRDKMPFGCGPRGEYTIRGRWWLPSSPSCDESCVSKLPVVRPSTKSVPTMH